MIILGITGSIGSGKSHFCKMLSQQGGVRVLSSDAEVHRLYANDKNLVKEISKIFPKAVVGGKVDRKILGEIVFNDATKKKQLENIVYPILKSQRENYIKWCRRNRVRLLVLEIPLLFENGLQGECDSVITLYCPYHIQKSRVMNRLGMSEEKLQSILATQMALHKKLKLTDHYFNTGRSKEFTAREVKSYTT